MTDPSPHNPAGTGLAPDVTMAPRAGAGLAIGALAGAPVPFPPAGPTAGLVAGFALVHTRSEDL